MTWFKLHAMGGQRAALFIYGDIVSERWLDEDVSHDSFRRELDALGDVQQIDMHINSPGGNVFAGIAIYSLLRQHPAHITAHIDGIAASIASVIMCAADEVLISDAGMVMIHNPWGISIGDSRDHRKSADMQDQARISMIAAYKSRVAMTDDELIAAMDAETWYTAADAVDFGWADSVIPAPAIAASMDLSRFNNPPKSLLGDLPKPVTGALKMPTDIKEPVVNSGGTPTAAPNVSEIEAAAKKKAIEAEQARRAEVRTIFLPFATREGVQSIMDSCLDDVELSADDASKKLLAHLGKNVESANRPHRVETGEDARDKFKRGAVEALYARGQQKHREIDGEFRAMGFKKLAARCLLLAGAKPSDVERLRDYDLIKAALNAATIITHSTSDFPVILQDAMHKSIVSTYNAFASTWRNWCRTAEVADFRQHARLKLGSFNNLAGVNENGEYQNSTVPDAEREYQQADTKGREIRIGRKILVNDDLQAFSDLGQAMGRAAARTVEVDALALLAANPTMADGVAFFHANHANLAGSGAAPTSATLATAEDAMRSQTDPGGNEVIDVRPQYSLSGLAHARTISELLGSEFTPETTGSRATRRVNALFGMVPQDNIIGTPRISGTEWYLFANPGEVPAFEVAFLDGEQEPFIDSMETLNPDGLKMLVRLDYGVKAIDWRGAYKNAGS